MRNYLIAAVAPATLGIAFYLVLLSPPAGIALAWLSGAVAVLIPFPARAR
jgi:xanthosine utilization system XapX-like protein